jgi:hypothetical protein
MIFCNECSRRFKISFFLGRYICKSDSFNPIYGTRNYCECEYLNNQGDCKLFNKPLEEKNITA